MNYDKSERSVEEVKAQDPHFAQHGLASRWHLTNVVGQRWWFRQMHRQGWENEVLTRFSSQTHLGEAEPQCLRTRSGVVFKQELEKADATGMPGYAGSLSLTFLPVKVAPRPPGEAHEH